MVSKTTIFVLYSQQFFEGFTSGWNFEANGPHAAAGSNINQDVEV